MPDTSNHHAAFLQGMSVVVYDARSIIMQGYGNYSGGAFSHAANALCVAVVTYTGTTSPSGLTLAGTSLTYLPGSKISYGSELSTEVWYIFRASAESLASIVLTFASNVNCAAGITSYLNADPNTFQGLTLNNGSGASVQTTRVTVPAGSPYRMLLILTGAIDTAPSTGTISLAPNNGETERREQNAPGSTTATPPYPPVASSISEYYTSAERELRVNATKAGRTISWATVGLAILTKNFPKTSHAAYMEGLGAGGNVKSSSPAYLFGNVAALSHHDAYLEGLGNVSDHVPAFLEGYTLEYTPVVCQVIWI